MKDSIFIARINGRLKTAIAQAAESDGSSMTEYVERLIKADLDKRGLTIEVHENIS